MVILESKHNFEASCCLRDTDSKTFWSFVFFEFGLKTVPPLLFFILGTVRYATIKDTAVGHCKYTNFFKAKVGISLLVGTFDLLQSSVIFI